MKRKTPAQDRSRHLVEALVEAAARLIASMPTEKISTTRIAEVAGVSVGSLYQYFSDKQALLVELVQRRLDADVGAVVGAAERESSGTFEGFTRALVTMIVDMHRRDRKLYARIFTLVPLLGMNGLVRRGAAEARRRVDAAFDRYEGQLRPRDRALTTFIAGIALESITHALVLERPELLDHPDLVEEITRLLTRYLEAEPS